jgi:hypothetical protein
MNGTEAKTRQRKRLSRKARTAQPAPQNLIVLELASGVMELALGVSRVDEEAKVIRGVLVVAEESKNTGRVLGLSERDFGDAVDRPYAYTTECLRRAVPLYEGAKVYDGHLEFGYDASGRRVLKEESHDNTRMVGWLAEARFVEGKGIVADLHYLESSEFSPILVEVAKRKPDAFALSHEAQRGPTPILQNGRIYLTEITAVSGVAVVNGNPGTTHSLFESAQRKGHAAMRHTIRMILESAPEDMEGTEEYGMLKDAVSEADGAIDPEMGDLPVEVPVDDVSPESQIRAGILAAIASKVAEASTEQLRAVLASLDMSDSVSDNLAAAAVTEAAPAEEPEPMPSEMPEEKETVEESARKSLDVNVVLECTDLLTARKVTPTRQFVTAMSRLLTLEERTAFANDLAGLSIAPVAPAKGGAPVLENAPRARSQPAIAPVQQPAVNIAEVAKKYAEPGSLANLIR